MGYTSTEKENYARSGFHNYKEFVRGFDALVVSRYGKDHNILWRKDEIPYKTKYGREALNHTFTFDFTHANDEARTIVEFNGDNEVFTRDGRDMWLCYLITGDIEETIMG